MQNNIPAVPHSYPEGTAYRVLRAMTVNGVQLQPGDLLPADSPIRKMADRVQALVRLRWLAAEVEMATATPPPASPAPVVDSAPAEASAEPSMIDISAMTGPQLIRKCRELGLKTSGSKQVLRKRLRDALG